MSNNLPILRLEWILPTGEKFTHEQAISEEAFWPAAMPLPLIAGGVEQDQRDHIKQIRDARTQLTIALAPMFYKFLQMALATKDGHL